MTDPAQAEREAIVALIRRWADGAFEAGEDEAYLALRGITLAIQAGEHLSNEAKGG